MAHSKGFFGLRRGSTRSHTYQVLNGMQITKDRVESVRNPQSRAQMIQRVVFATVTQAAEKLLPIIGISQQGVTNEVESRRRWISANVKLLRNAANRMANGGAVEAAFAPMGNTQLIPNNYQISRGSLQLPAALVPKTEDRAVFGGGYSEVGTLGILNVGQTYNVFELWSILFGIGAGDQLTFPQIYGEGYAQTLQGTGGGYADLTRFTQFVAPRLVLLETLTGNETSITLAAGTTAQEIADFMLRAVDTEQTWYEVSNILDRMTITEGETAETQRVIAIADAYNDVFAVNNDDPIRAIGCIKSHKDSDSGKWQYSTSYLACTWTENGKDSEIGDYFGFTLNNAIDTYLKNVTMDGEGNFLQRGGENDIVPDSFM